MQLLAQLNAVGLDGAAPCGPSSEEGMQSVYIPVASYQQEAPVGSMTYLYCNKGCVCHAG